MDYDYKSRKILAVISDALPPGKALNALGHLAFAAGNRADGSWMGRDAYATKDGVLVRGISKFPVIALEAPASKLKLIAQKARDMKEVYVGAYPQEMFDTGPDDELNAAMERARSDDLVFHALLLVGPADQINALTGGLKLYQ